MKIRKAIASDAQILTDLTIRSKGYWNYSAKQIEAWKHDLTITAAYIRKNSVFILQQNDQVIGYYSWIDLNELNVELDNVFVEPTCIRKGYGDVLMKDFLERIKQIGKKKIILFSEPRSELFYAKFGFITIGQQQSAEKNRYLPIMEFQFI